jgi:hypothetical protein
MTLSPPVPASLLPGPPHARAATFAIAVLPLLGVLWLDWSVAEMFGFYWIESAAIGLFHWLKMLAARGTIVDGKLERALAANTSLTAEQRVQQIQTSRSLQHAVLPGLFLVHYGLFCAVHAAIIVFLFDGAFAEVASPLGMFALAAITAMQAVDYARFRADPAQVALPRNFLFLQPYKRVIVLQLVLILGAIPAKAGYPLFAAFLLTAIKLLVESGVSLPGSQRR